MKAHPLRIPEEIISLAAMRAKEEHVDKSTALRQLLYMGAEEYVLQLVEEGRISAGRASELLEIPVQDIYRAAERHGIRTGATPGQRSRSLETMKRLL